MSANVFIVSRNVVFWDYVNRPPYSRVEYIGYILDEDLIQLQKMAKKLNLSFFVLIDPFDHMVFNKKHMKLAMDELKMLKNLFPEIIDKLNPLIKAINLASQKNGLYIKFESD